MLSAHLSTRVTITNAMSSFVHGERSHHNKWLIVLFRIPSISNYPRLDTCYCVHSRHSSAFTHWEIPVGSPRSATRVVPN